MEREDRSSKEATQPIDDFIEVVQALFSEKGCPWVRELQLDLLQRTLVEEAYEVIASVAAADWREVTEELGDLLFNIFCIAKVLEREGKARWQDPFSRAAEKYTRRSPHVFVPGKELKTKKEVEVQWLQIKKEEKKNIQEEKSELMKAWTIFPSLTLIEKLWDVIGHDPEKRSLIERHLMEKGSSEESQFAKDFMLTALRAHEKELSLEIVLKKEMKELIKLLEGK